MDKDDPAFVTRILDDFRAGAKLSGLPYPGLSRLCGAFPLPTEVKANTPVLGPKDPSKRPFDETLLNQNDYLIKRKRGQSHEDSLSSESMSETSILASPWEIRRIKNELTEAKAEILTLESRISQLHGLRKETELLFEQEKASLKQNIERDRQKIKELETRVKKLKKKEEKVKEDLEVCIEELSGDKRALEAKLSECKEETSTFTLRLSQAEEKNAEVNRELNKLKIELLAVQEEAKMAKSEAEAMGVQITELRKLTRTHQADRTALTQAQIRIAELENEVANYGESVALVKSQQAKLIKYSELERQLLSLTQENTRLRDSTSTSLYLEGVVEELRGRLESVEEREKEVVNAKVELGLAQAELAEFRGIAAEALGQSASPVTLTQYLRTIHADHLLVSSQHSQLQARLKTMEEVAEASMKEREGLRADINKLHSELETCSAQIRRLKKQNALITWERNDLRSLVDSCQKEVTVSGGSADLRADVLEKLVEGYRKRLDQVDIQDDTTIRKERDELKARVDALESELEHRALKGDFNTKDTKILHLRMNPTTEAEKERTDALAEAQAEVARLRERVRLLQEGVAADLTQAVEDGLNHATSQQLQELQEKVKSQEVQNQRLLEAFKTKGHEFREAIYALLGYKVDSLPNQVYRLASLYAESPDQHLIFKVENGGMELLETEFSTTLSELIELHLIQHNSIPMFLSSVTIDLFKQQTHTQP